MTVLATDMCPCGCKTASCATVQDLVEHAAYGDLAGLLSTRQVSTEQIRIAVARAGTYPLAVKEWEAWLATNGGGVL